MHTLTVVLDSKKNIFLTCGFMHSHLAISACLVVVELFYKCFNCVLCVCVYFYV